MTTGKKTQPNTYKDCQELNFTFTTLAEINQILCSIDKNLPDHPQLLLGIKELMVNAVEHGNLEIGYSLKTELLAQGNWLEEVERRLALKKNKHKKASLKVCFNATNVKIEVTDAGQGFDYHPYNQPISKKSLFFATSLHGRGLHLARQMAFDDVQFLEGGKKVVATKKR